MPPSAATPAATLLHAELEAAPDPHAGGFARRFARGFRYPFLGWRFVSAHPRLYRYCIVPFVINLVIMSALTVLLYRYYGDIVAWIWRRPDTWWWLILWYLLYVFVLLAVLVLAYVAFFVLQALLAAPFNDLLSERTEEILTRRAPPPFSLGRFLRSTAVTLGHESVKLLLLVGILAPLWFVTWLIPAVGSLLFAVLGGAVSSFFLGYDFHDYALARRRFSFGAKWRLLWGNAALTLGFGSAVSLMLLVPVLGLLFPPFAAVGGTILCLDYERYRRL